METPTQAQSFGDIRIGGEGNTFVINQVMQISIAEVKTWHFNPASPYLGLKRFDAGNKDVFFGRDQLVAQLLNLTSQRNLVLVSGASGSGKSSVVRAGLVPQLTDRLPGRFHAVTMTPDADPFDSLRAALMQRVDSKKLAPLRAGTGQSLVETITQVRPAPELWLLVVDQFEEIFTRCDDAERRAAFLNGLTRLALLPQSEVKVILSMRADFFDRFGPHPEFGKLAEPGLCLVMDMQPSELRAAIEQPAARHGVVFEPGLVEQIIADVKGRPGALPLLQYTLDLLWHEDNPADDRTLNTVNYHKLGGVEGALRLRANALYEWVNGEDSQPRSTEQKEAMRRLFLGLLDLTSQGGQAVSKRARLSEFPREEDRALLAELVDEKLLVSNAPIQTTAKHTNDGTVELAHEALLSAWPFLKDWIDQAREVIYVRNRLSADAHHFAQVVARAPSLAPDELWGGTRLAQALELRSRGDFHTLLGGLNSEEETFLNASEARKARLEQELAAQLKREREAAEKNRQLLLDTYIDRGHQLLFDKHQPYPAALWLHRAYQQGSKNPALPHLLKSAMLPIDATKAVLSDHRAGVRSARYSPDGRRILTASQDNTVRVWDTENGRLLRELTGHGGRVESACYSPDGQRILTASVDRTARVWNAEDGRLITELTGHGNWIQSARYSPDGLRILTASVDKTARVWDAEHGCLLTQLSGHGDIVNSASYSPDGRRILTASDDRTARVWDAEHGRLLTELAGHKDTVVCARYSSDGRCILTASDDRTARVWDAERGRVLTEFRGHRGPVLSARYSPDGHSVVTASWDKTARIWDVKDGRLRAELMGHRGWVVSGRYSPDGRRILTASVDNTARVWDAEHGRLLTEFKGHQGPVRSARYSPDGRCMLTASADNTARISDAGDGRLLAQLSGHGRHIQSATYSPDGRCIVTAHADHMARVWDTESGRLLTELTGHRDTVRSAKYSPDGRRILTAGDDNTARIWDAEHGRLLTELTGHRATVRSARYSPDGRRILTTSDDKTTRVWDAEDGHPLAALTGHGDRVLSARYSPDGRRILTAGDDKTARVWDAEDGHLITTLMGHGAAVLSARYSPDGRRIFIEIGDKAARIWDAADWRLLTELTGDGDSLRATYSPDGRRILTASDDKTARVWDAEHGRLLAALTGHGDRVLSARYSPDGRRIVTGSADHTARIWDAEDGRLLAALTGHGANVWNATYSPDGRRILTVSDDHTARVWDASPETRTPEQLGRVIRCRAFVRFEPEDGNVIVPYTPSPTDSDGESLSSAASSPSS